MLSAAENASGLELISKSDKIDVSGELAIENPALTFNIEKRAYKFVHSVGENECGSYRMLKMSSCGISTKVDIQ